jgi:hypothetical protein
MMRVELATQFIQVPAELFEQMSNGLTDLIGLLRSMRKALEDETDFEQTASDIADYEKATRALAEEAETGLRRGGFYALAFAHADIDCRNPSESHRRRSRTRIYGYDNFFDDDGESTANEGWGEGSGEGSQQPPPAAGSSAQG